MTTEPRCSEKIFHTLAYYQCYRPSKVKRNGKDYCNLHDPVKVADRRTKANAKSQARYAERTAKFRQEYNDRTVGAWMRRFKKNDYDDILRLKPQPDTDRKESAWS